MKAVHKLILLGVVLGTYCALGADIPMGTDLAEMNDYTYYTEHSDEGRAIHALKYSGEYTLSEDKVWSALYIGTVLSEPAILNLRGHTLTLNGCDAIDSTATLRPLVGNDNTTLVISNGTVSSVYDPTAYPWTKATGESYYSSRRGVLVSRYADDAVGSQLVVAKGGNLLLDDGQSATLKGNGHRLVVEDGGTFDGKLSFAGNENRFVFKSGSTFSKISAYVDGHGFPKNIWFNAVSNIVEIGDSTMLTTAGITTLTPDANASAGSFHCGLAVSSANFNWVSTTRGLIVGEKLNNAPVLFEMKDGATMTMEKSLIVGNAIGGSRSWMTLDGAGTTYTGTGDRPAYIGFVYGVTNVLLRLTNGAKFDAVHASSQVVVGSGTNANDNAIEVLSGSHMVSSKLSIGTRPNYGNRVLISGAGSTMTNDTVEIGNNSGNSGGGHSLTVTDHGSLSVLKINSGDGRIYLGYRCAECRLNVSDYGEVTMDGELLLGSANRVAGCSNRVAVCNGGTISTSAFRGYGNDSELVVSNGTVSAKGFEFGTNGVISVSGQHALVETSSGDLKLGQGGTLKIAVPKEGFTDRNGVPRAPVNITGSVSFDDALTFEIDVSEMGRRHSDVKEAPLLYVSNGISDNLLAKITVVGENCYVKRSSDGKTLKAVKSNGLVLFVR